MKYCLREEIEKFEFMVGQEEEKVRKMKLKAKEHIDNGNKKVLRLFAEKWWIRRRRYPTL